MAVGGDTRAENASPFAVSARSSISIVNIVAQAASPRSAATETMRAMSLIGNQHSHLLPDS